MPGVVATTSVFPEKQREFETLPPNKVVSPVKKKSFFSKSAVSVSFSPSFRKGKLALKPKKPEDDYTSDSTVDGVSDVDERDENDAGPTNILDVDTMSQAKHAKAQKHWNVVKESIPETIPEDDADEDGPEMGWEEAVDRAAASHLDKQCNACNLGDMVWYCHGCKFNYCRRCHNDVHQVYVKQFKANHVIERIDGKCLKCCYCQKSVWELSASGYTSRQKQYQKKYDAALASALRKGTKSVHKRLEMSWMKQEAKLKRTLRPDVKETQLDDALAEMNLSVRARVASEYEALLKPMEYSSKQVLLDERVEEENAAAFQFCFDRQDTLCKACCKFMDTHPRIVTRPHNRIAAYAAPQPYKDPAIIAKRNLMKIRREREARMAAQRLKEQQAIQKPKTRFCVVQ
jgi:hypothetical protein